MKFCFKLLTKNFGFVIILLEKGGCNLKTFKWIDLKKVKNGISCLGPAGTFSEIVARDWAKEEGIEAKVVLCKDISEVVSNVRERRVRHGIVPINNAYEGDVHQAIDEIIDEKNVFVIGEIYKRIIHNLIGTKKIKFSEIRAVISHPQALRQCQSWLKRNLSKAKRVTVESTAEAVMKLSKKEPWKVAIGSKEAVQRGEIILAKGIQDMPQNITRFLVISILPRLEGLTGPVKTTLCFKISHQPGALVRALSPLAKFNIAWVEVRPNKADIGKVIFWLDVVANPDDIQFKKALILMAKRVSSFLLLGVYPLHGEF